MGAGPSSLAPDSDTSGELQVCGDLQRVLQEDDVQDILVPLEESWRHVMGRECVLVS